MPDKPSSSDQRHRQPQGTRVQQDDELTSRYRHLSDQLSRVEDAQESANETRETTGTEIGRGLKMGTEFVAGVLVGAGIGWVLDQMIGTTPWGLIIFLLLGFAAGVLNVLRSANLVAEAGIRRDDSESGR